MFYTVRVMDYILYGQPIIREVTNRFCEDGVHAFIIGIIEEIGIPWDGGKKFLEECIHDMGLPRGHVYEKHGIIRFRKRFSDFEMYNALIKGMTLLYNENFLEFQVTPYKQEHGDRLRALIVNDKKDFE